jgi:hypothetical protein
MRKKEKEKNICLRDLLSKDYSSWGEKMICLDTFTNALLTTKKKLSNKKYNREKNYW